MVFLVDFVLDNSLVALYDLNMKFVLTGKQIRKLRDKALREQRKKSAPPTKVIESKKKYKRRTLFLPDWI